VTFWRGNADLPGCPALSRIGVKNKPLAGHPDKLGFPSALLLTEQRGRQKMIRANDFKITS
jgi:hypothetical protein